jgi:hypothetical protein
MPACRKIPRNVPRFKTFFWNRKVVCLLPVVRRNQQPLGHIVGQGVVLAGDIDEQGP